MHCLAKLSHSEFSMLWVANVEFVQSETIDMNSKASETISISNDLNQWRGSETLVSHGISISGTSVYRRRSVWII